MMSFTELVKNIIFPKQTFTVKGSIDSTKTHPVSQDTSDIERQLFGTKLEPFIHKFHNILEVDHAFNTTHLKELQEMEQSLEITDEKWKDAWRNVNTYCVCRVKETEFMI